METKMTIKYRRADAKDSDEIASVLIKNYKFRSIGEARKAYQEELGRFSYIAAEDGGRIIGTACWRIHGLPKHQLAEIGRVAALPEYADKGVMEALFGTAVQDADKFYKSHGTKIRKVYAYVHSSNKKMQKFYSSIKLIKEAVLKDHYYKGEDEFVYSMFFD